MLPHPVIQYLFAWVCKRVATAAPDPPQLDVELLAQQTAQRTPQCRASGVAKVMRAQSLLEVRLAGRASVHRRRLRRNADVQQYVLTEAMAAAGVDTGRGLVEIERIHTRRRRDRARLARNVERAVEASRMEEPLAM
jgi:hypothetical protein